MFFFSLSQDVEDSFGKSWKLFSEQYIKIFFTFFLQAMVILVMLFCSFRAHHVEDHEGNWGNIHKLGNNDNELIDETDDGSVGEEFKNTSVDFAIMKLEKRVNHQLKHPCSCYFKFQNKRFAGEAYPQSHLIKVCDTEKNAKLNNCHNGSKCKEIYHPIFLLRSKSEDLPRNPEKHIDLPRTLREDFFWSEDEISIDCRCSF
jgi:hypothetical protein